MALHAVVTCFGSSVFDLVSDSLVIQQNSGRFGNNCRAWV